MPVMDTGMTATLGPQDGSWQFVNTSGVPKEATAIILRLFGPYSTGTANLYVANYYPGDNSTILFDYYVTRYMPPLSRWDLVVAYNGFGSLAVASSLQSSFYPCSAAVLGYFTAEEFVRFDSRETYVSSTSGLINISSEDWYRRDATAYLRGGGTDTRLAHPSWVDRTTSTLNVKPTIFWPNDSSQVLRGTGSADLCITGYFITQSIYKGTSPSGQKSFVAKDKPLADVDEYVRQEDHETDPRYVFDIALSEYQLSYQWNRMITVPANGFLYGEGGGGNLWNGYDNSELYIYPSQEDGIEGTFDVYFDTYQYYNSDSFIDYIGFKRTTVIHGDTELDYDPMVLGEPDVIQNATMSMAVPVTYRTVTGEYTWTGTFAMYLSGGSTNVQPALSLGGLESTTAMGSDLFGDITNRKAQLGGSEYRCVYLKNTSGSETAYGLIVWVDDPAEYGNDVAIGVDPAGIGGSVQSIANEDTAPTGVVFHKPSGEQNGLSLGVIAPGESLPLWIKRTGDIQNQQSGAETVSFSFSVLNNG